MGFRLLFCGFWDATLMEDLSVHYARLLGLGEDWKVADVDLDLSSQRVTIRLERVGGSACYCPVCGEQRPLKDHAAEREWRHLDTMQFETVLVARTPRTSCPKCGVLNVDLPWAEPHGRFTLMFQAFAIRVLQASASIEQGRKLLRLSWHSAQDIMSVAVRRGLEVRDTEDIASCWHRREELRQGPGLCVGARRSGRTSRAGGR